MFQSGISVCFEQELLWLRKKHMEEDEQSLMHRLLKTHIPATVLGSPAYYEDQLKKLLATVRRYGMPTIFVASQQTKSLTLAGKKSMTLKLYFVALAWTQITIIIFQLKTHSCLFTGSVPFWKTLCLHVPKCLEQCNTIWSDWKNKADILYMRTACSDKPLRILSEWLMKSEAVSLDTGMKQQRHSMYLNRLRMHTFISRCKTMRMHTFISQCKTKCSISAGKKVA